MLDYVKCKNSRTKVEVQGDKISGLGFAAISMEHSEIFFWGVGTNSRSCTLINEYQMGE